MIIYLVKCTIAMGVSWLIYQKFLAKQKTFWLNRIYLLTAIIGSTLAPIVKLPSGMPALSIKNSIYPLLDLTKPTPVEVVDNVATMSSYSISDYVTWIIIAISILFAVRFVYIIFKIVRLSQVSSVESIEGISIAIIDDNRTPFSLFNTMYVNQTAHEKGIDDAIFLHEKYHIQQRHSVDRIIVDIISIVQWVNPFLYLLKRDLIDNHEYAADAYAIDQTNDSQSYLSLIVSNARSSSSQNFLLQQFSHSSPRKRIKMITLIQQAGKGWYRPLAFILLLACLISCSDDYANPISSENPYPFSKESDSKKPPPTIAWPAPEVLLPINRPLERLLEKWTYTQTFGVRIDNKKVENVFLLNSSPNDFSFFSVREVKSDSEDYGKFQYTVYILTNEGYKNRLEEMQIRYKKYKKDYPELYAKQKQ
ncbi:MAG: bla regulator protein BlaR1 [Saprospiraceae bacterium]|jgi:bla regulator protein BlaR1